MDLISQYDSCTLCPRSCMADRRTAGAKGFCGCGDTVMAARAALHQWEEPWISGIHGSGTVFFTGCTLRCCFCQNYPISQEGLGKELTVRQLGDIFLRLQDEGAHNINLVTATQYLPSVIPALDLVKPRLSIPVVYNCGGYERTEVVEALKGYVDIWLPDLKYYSSRLSARYSKAPDYFEKASAAILQMIRQTGTRIHFLSGSGNPRCPRMHTDEKGSHHTPHGAARGEGRFHFAAALDEGSSSGREIRCEPDEPVHPIL